MEGIFTLIFLVITIAGFFEKAKKEQQNRQRQYPGRQYKNTAPVSPKNVLRKQINRSSGGQKADISEKTQVASSDKDRKMTDRHTTANMSNDRQPSGFYNQRSTNAGREVQVPDSKLTASDEEAIDFDISAEDLMKSIIMAEILGKPRAMKRSIR